jgi:hypothetical protein
LDDGAESVINDFPFLVVETSGSEDQVLLLVISIVYILFWLLIIIFISILTFLQLQIEAAKVALAPAAKAEFAKATPKLKFFYVESEDEGLYQAIRRFAKVSSEKLYIVHAAEGKKYLAPDQSITPENISAFVHAFQSGSLTSVPIR